MKNITSNLTQGQHQIHRCNYIKLRKTKGNRVGRMFITGCYCQPIRLTITVSFGDHSFNFLAVNVGVYVGTVLGRIFYKDILERNKIIDGE